MSPFEQQKRKKIQLFLYLARNNRKNINNVVLTHFYYKIFVFSKFFLTFVSLYLRGSHSFHSATQGLRFREVVLHVLSHENRLVIWGALKYKKIIPIEKSETMKSTRSRIYVLIVSVNVPFSIFY